MYNQTEVILSQYELEIQQITKGRDVYICTTDKGVKSLVSFRGSEEKGEFLKAYLCELKAAGFPVEQIYENKNGKAVTEDENTGERFFLKDYIKGSELNMNHNEELMDAMVLLADYHKISENIHIEIPQLIRETGYLGVEVRRKHYKELVKTKNYIRGRKKKNEFDRIFMKAYDDMIETAESSLEILEQQEDEDVSFGICHGDLNHHNILRIESGWRMVNFEHFFYGWKVLDLANFLRKTLEKHNWDVELGTSLIKNYEKNNTLSEAETLQLYAVLLFPEKFWKISNHYMNSRKSWISEKDIEKIKKVVEQEEQRKNFIRNLFPFSM